MFFDVSSIDQSTLMCQIKSHKLKKKPKFLKVTNSKKKPKFMENLDIHFFFILILFII